MRHTQEYRQIIRQHLVQVNAEPVTAQLRSLQKWQAKRLMETHRNLYQQDRFKPAMHFFVDELYSADHFRQRNAEIISALPLMCSTMPESLLEVVEQAAHLHLISLQMDQQLLSKLSERTIFDELSLSEWQIAYSACDNQDQRIQQIDMIENLGNELARLVRKPMVSKLLHWSSVPARIAGYGSIHAFVCQGFDAFDALEDPQDFLRPVIATERALSARWFEGSTAQSEDQASASS